MFDEIKALARAQRIEWKKHALKRLFERGISRDQVFEVLSDCELVEEHELERPLPSILVLGYSGNDPLHVMLAVDQAENLLWVITLYKPTLDEWEPDYKTRRRR